MNHQVLQHKSFLNGDQVVIDYKEQASDVSNPYTSDKIKRNRFDDDKKSNE
jgi:hypothetical protein